MNSLVVENKLKEILRSEKKLSMKCLIKVMSKAVVSFFFGSDDLRLEDNMVYIMR
jgi:hypothetical protein